MGSSSINGCSSAEGALPQPLRSGATPGDAATAGPAVQPKVEWASWSTLGQGRVQERHHRSQDELGLGQPEKVVVPGNTASRQAGTPTRSPLTSTTQPQEPDHVLEPDGVAISNGEQPRRGHPPDVGLGQPVNPLSSCPSLPRSSCSLPGPGDLAR